MQGQWKHVRRQEATVKQAPGALEPNFRQTLALHLTVDRKLMLDGFLTGGPAGSIQALSDPQQPAIGR